MPTITAVLHTYNEEGQIARCLEALRWVDEILLVDTHSTDRTVEIARAYTDRILSRRYINAAATKNWALDRAPDCDWYLFVDADEVVTPALAEEIGTAIQSDDFSGYAINILTCFGDRPSRSPHWNPNYQLRLFRKGAGRWEDREVHAPFRLQGPSRRLRSPIRHYPYPDISACLTKLDRYTTFEARQRLKEGADIRSLHFPVKAILRSILHFYRIYIRKRGYRDGRLGLVIGLISALYIFFSDAKFWEAHHNPRADARENTPNP